MIGAVHHCDCLLGLQGVPEHSIDFVFADLPYGVTQNAWDEPLALEPLWNALHRACKPSAAMVFTAVQPFASVLIASNPQQFRYEMIWRKNKATGFLNAKKRPLRSHENILVFWNETPHYEPQMTEGHEPGHAVNNRLSGTSNYGATPKTRSWGGSTKRYPTTVLDVPVVNTADPLRIRPNQKPEALPAWFIRTYTRPGAVVLDPTFGSGSTLLAAKKLGRRFVGFETDAAMVEKVAALLADVPEAEACTTKIQNDHNAPESSTSRKDLTLGRP